MIPTTVVNHLTVVHKKSDGMVTATPDVCLTPSGPVPVPYTNIAFSKDLVNQATTVLSDGEGIALKDSVFITSIGDEPGTAGGVISGVNKGKAIFLNYSMDVFAEGRNVCRLTDPMLNNGNSPNTPPGPETQGNRLPPNIKDKLCKAFCWCNKPGNKGDDFIQKVPVGPQQWA